MQQCMLSYRYGFLLQSFVILNAADRKLPATCGKTTKDNGQSWSNHASAVRRKRIKYISNKGNVCERVANV
jgi:hypothetical protein